MYKITPVNEPNGEGNGWDECPEAQALSIHSSMESLENETGNCVVVHFENAPSIGFPPNHLVTVDSTLS